MSRFHKASRGGLTLVAAALVSAGLAVPAAGAPPARSGALTGAEALSADAQAYGDALNISDAAALELLKDQITGGQLVERVAALAGDRFAGAWLGQDRAVQVHLRLTHGQAVAGLQRLLAAVDVRASVQYDASLSRPALVDAAQKVAQVFASGSFGIDGVEVDDEMGGLVLVGNREAVPDAVSRATAAISSLVPIRIEQHDSPPARDANRGGVAESNCTAGFSVTNGSSTGLMTAGHCPNTQNYALSPNGATSYVAAFRAETRSRIADLQWAVTSSHNAVNSFFGSSASTPTTRVGQGTATNGQLLCHRGKTTGYSCGYVTSTAYAPTYTDACPGTTCSASFVRVEGQSLANLGGDSGGPWFSGGYAYGIHKGGQDGTVAVWACFTPVGRMSDIGVALV